MNNYYHKDLGSDLKEKILSQFKKLIFSVNCLERLKEYVDEGKKTAIEAFEFPFKFPGEFRTFGRYKYLENSTFASCLERRCLYKIMMACQMLTAYDVLKSVNEIDEFFCEINEVIEELWFSRFNWQNTERGW